MPDLTYEKHERYALFTLNRPEQLNALGGSLFQELDAALADFAADPALRVGILTGAGRAFSAGADLKEMHAQNEARDDAPRRVEYDLNAARRFSRQAKPFIAAINGLCIGGGLERALDCDIRICSRAASFGLFEVKQGLLASYAIHHLVRVVPFGEAMYLLLTGDQISAEQALHCGLVHEVLEPEAVLPRAVAIAELIAANPSLAVEGTKAVAQHWRQLAIDESYRLHQWVARTVLNSEDAREGPRAFVEKRAPRWQGR